MRFSARPVCASGRCPCSANRRTPETAAGPWLHMSETLLLAAIADDYTGGSDMAGMLAAHGVRTLQTFGLPDEQTLARAADAEALVVSLKTRSTAAAYAVQQSLEALSRLRKLRPRQLQ